MAINRPGEVPTPSTPAPRPTPLPVPRPDPNEGSGNISAAAAEWLDRILNLPIPSSPSMAAGLGTIDYTPEVRELLQEIESADLSSLTVRELQEMRDALIEREAPFTPDSLLKALGETDDEAVEFEFDPVVPGSLQGVNQTDRDKLHLGALMNQPIPNPDEISAVLSKLGSVEVQNLDPSTKTTISGIFTDAGADIPEDVRQALAPNIEPPEIATDPEQQQPAPAPAEPQEGREDQARAPGRGGGLIQLPAAGGTAPAPAGGQEDQDRSTMPDTGMGRVDVDLEEPSPEDIRTKEQGDKEGVWATVDKAADWLEEHESLLKYGLPFLIGGLTESDAEVAAEAAKKVNERRNARIASSAGRDRGIKPSNRPLTRLSTGEEVHPLPTTQPRPPRPGG